MSQNPSSNSLVSTISSWLFRVIIIFAIYPCIPGADPILCRQFTTLFIYAILALGLNVIVGYTGLIHLGIAGFFGIGAYITGVLTIGIYPFHWNFILVCLLSMIGAGVVAMVVSAPMLRLRGDYLALVTLGFGQIVIYLIRNLDQITAGTQGLTPIIPPFLPEALSAISKGLNLEDTWQGYVVFYYITLVLLGLVLLFLRNLERSRLGRAMVALKEDELAASSMGINPARIKLIAITIGAALAGLAGCLYATSLRSTAGPQAYDFNRSMITLCCVILGGLGNRSGVLLGVLLLIGYDNVLTPVIDNWLQQQNINPNNKSYLRLTGWRLAIFGLALILVMRFRPDGLIPTNRGESKKHS